MKTFTNLVQRPDLVLGILTATPVSPGPSSAELDKRLAQILDQRSVGLDDKSERARLLSRDILRNESYKPSGRGKPANEFLLRSATDDTFPRVVNIVDVINYISLKYMVPISVWDIRAAETDNYEFRTGREDEDYVFNHAGHSIKLRDLIVGCAVAGDRSKPIVNPVKDSMATKISDATTAIAVCIYFHSDLGGAYMAEASSELATLISQCGDDVTINTALCPHAEFVTLA